MIRATATNQDGRTSTITVPSGAAQEALLRAVCAQAGAAPGLGADAALALVRELGVTGVEIAAINGPELVNLAGDVAGVERVLDHLAAHRPEVFQRRIRMRFAAHSHHMDPLRAPLLAALEGLDAHPPRVPFISTVTGAAYQGAPDAAYWWRNVREPVHFDAAVRAAMAGGHTLFLEVGPHAQLAGLVGQALGGGGAVAATLRRGQDDLHSVHAALAALHVNGVAVDWRTVNGPAVPAVALPAWPWRHERLWTESEERRAALVEPEPHPLLGRRLPGAAVQWQRELDAATPPWLADHAVGSEAVFPAAGYIELMLAAGRELFGDQTLELEHLRFAQALFLRQDAAEFVLTAYDPDREAVRVLSRRRDGAPEWTLRTFWQRQLADPPAALAPCDHPAGAPPRGRTLDRPLPPGLTDSVLAQARAWKVSWFVVLLTAFQVLVQRRTGALDVPITTTATGRTQARFEPLVGSFVNQLVLRLRFDPAAPFRANVEARAAVLADALAHQDLPFTEFLPAARAAAPGSALDELCFAMRRPDNFDTRSLGAVLLSESAEGFEFEGTRIRALPLARDSGLRPLSVFAQESGGVVHMLWNYDASRFEAASVESLAGEYAQVLHACLAEPAAGVRARTRAGA